MRKLKKKWNGIRRPRSVNGRKVGGSFFGCYLLTSLSPRHKGHTYIGFTVNPKRRIRQHNGEITSGAHSTQKKRPWEMVLCIHGFPTHVSALQFEWAWQHPKESVAVKETAAGFKTLGGLSNKIKLALTMITLPSWDSMDLTVSFFNTNYMKHAAGCPSLPPQMKLHFSSLDDLPCYLNPHITCASDYDDDNADDNDIQAHCSNETDPSIDTVPLIETQNSTHQNSPEFGFIETDPSIDTQSYTLKNTSVFGFVETNPSIESVSYTQQNTFDFGYTENFSSTYTQSYTLQNSPEFGFIETDLSIDTQSYTLQNTSDFDFVETNPSIETRSYTQQNTSDFGFIETNPSIESRSYTQQNTSDFGFIETNPSIESQSYTQQNTSDFGFTETYPSTYTQSYTLQNTSEQVLNPFSDDDTRPLEQFSSFYQFSDDELLQPSRRDHVTPLGSSVFSNKRFPILKKHINPCHLQLVDAHNFSENNLNDNTSLGDYSPLHQPNSFVREEPLTVGIEDFTCILIDESPSEKHPPTRNNLRTHSTEVSVEVIDLYTPTPDCRIIAGSKKRRVSRDCSNFIDLTRSPLFVEL